MDRRRFRDGRVLPDTLTVDEHVHMRPHATVLVEDPAGHPRMPSLQLPQDLPHRGPIDRDLPVASGEVS